MYAFTVQCPITLELFNIIRNNYSSANIMENQFKNNGILYQLHNNT